MVVSVGTTQPDTAQIYHQMIDSRDALLLKVVKPRNKLVICDGLPVEDVSKSSVLDCQTYKFCWLPRRAQFCWYCSPSCVG